MKSISGRQMCRVLEQRGWTLARINGSHHIYRDWAAHRRASACQPESETRYSTGHHARCGADGRRPLISLLNYIKNEAKVRGMERFDAKVHPPPDLAIEVDVTRRSVPREPIYAKLGVPESWRSKNVRISVRLLGEDGKYHDALRSAAFPFLPLREFDGFVRRLLVEDPNASVRAFRQWGVHPPAHGAIRRHSRIFAAGTTLMGATQAQS